MKIRTISSFASGKTIAINHTVPANVWETAGVAREEGYRSMSWGCVVSRILGRTILVIDGMVGIHLTKQ